MIRIFYIWCVSHTTGYQQRSAPYDFVLSHNIFILSRIVTCIASNTYPSEHTGPAIASYNYCWVLYCTSELSHLFVMAFGKIAFKSNCNGIQKFSPMSENEKFRYSNNRRE
jgi:hypothetical protein